MRSNDLNGNFLMFFCIVKVHGVNELAKLNLKFYHTQVLMYDEK